MNEFFGLVTPTSKNEVPNQLHYPVKICVVFLIKKKLWFWAIMGFQRIRETVSQKKKILIRETAELMEKLSKPLHDSLSTETEAIFI